MIGAADAATLLFLAGGVAALGQKIPVYGELPNWPDSEVFEVLIPLPGCSTSLSYSFI